MTIDRPRVLVMFEHFPRDSNDVGGVFSLDYLAAIAAVCDVTLLLPGTDDRRGLARSTDAGGSVERLTWTPWIRGGGSVLQRLGRVEALYELGRLAPRLPDVDIIHAHGPVFHGTAALTLGKKLRVPVLLTVHTGPFSKLLGKAGTRWFTRRTIEGVDCVCPVSHDLRQQIERSGIHPRRIEVTYNPVNTDLFQPGPEAEGRSPRRMVFAGRLEEYKGGFRVLRAFAEVAGRWPEWTLVIAGDGPERPQLEDFLRRFPGIARRVRLVGAYTRPDLAALLAASDCFVFPSRHETFGLVLAEAMSAGLPVIGPNCTAPPEFIDSRSGLLVPPDDHASLVEAMSQLLTDLPRYRSDVIRKSIVERFGLAAFGNRLLSLYRDLCGDVEGGAACVASPG